MNRTRVAYVGLVALLRKATGLIALIVLLPQAAEATQYVATGTITTIQAYSITGNPASQQGYSMFQISSGLVGGCGWLYVNASDSNTLAALFSSKATAASVTVYYDNSLTPPWGNPIYCGAQVIQLN